MKTSQQILSDDIKKLEFIQQQLGEKIMKNIKIESLLQEINNRIQIVLQIIENEYKSDKDFQDWKNKNLIDTNTYMQENLDSDLLYSFNLNDLSLNLSKELQINQFQESDNVVQTERVAKKPLYNLSIQSDMKKSSIYTKPFDLQSNKSDRKLLKTQESEKNIFFQQQNKQCQLVDEKILRNNWSNNNQQMQKQQQQQQQQQPNNQSKPVKSTQQYQVKQELYNNIKENMAKFNMSIVDQPQISEDGNISQCPICKDSYFTDSDIQDKYVISLSCSHQFHYDCLQPIITKDFIKCPICNQIFGQMIGDQPDGEMNVEIIKKNCEGYTCDTIQITYDFKSGYRNKKNYQGTKRITYLPNNLEGQQILGLLRKAFDQKLIFTIGTSSTTGQDNSIIWNGIHHKTKLNGGSQVHGYPDPQYFYRVIDELKQKGIILNKG